MNSCSCNHGDECSETELRELCTYLRCQCKNDATISLREHLKKVMEE